MKLNEAEMRMAYQIKSNLRYASSQATMLMCHKVTHKNLIDSSPLFRKHKSGNR